MCRVFISSRQAPRVSSRASTTTEAGHLHNATQPRAALSFSVSMTGRMAMMRAAKDFERLGAMAAVLSRAVWTKRSLGLRTKREFSGSSKGGGKGVRAGQKQKGPGANRGSDGGVARSVTKGGSSGLWMKRHLKDPYVSAAIEAGAPSRAAFKLVEINDKHRVLSAGDRVVDLGAAPGGWSMVAARIVHARGARGSQQRGGRSSRRGPRGGTPPPLPPPLPEARVEAAEKRGRRGGAVVAVDLLELETDLPGVEAIHGDFRDAGVESKIFSILAAREQPPVPKNGHQQQQQQQQQPTARQSTAMSTAERTDPTNTETALHNHDGESNTDTSDVVDSEERSTSEAADRSTTNSSEKEAFLLRGTSASRSLIPRPEQPTTDPLGDLFLAAKPSAPETAATTTAAVAQEQADPAPPLVGHSGRHHRGGFSQDAESQGRSAANNNPRLSPASPSLLPRPPIRRANVVLSDMAPSFSGDRDTDQARVAGLVLDALAACLGDEDSRRREPSNGGAALDAGGDNGGRPEGIGVWEGNDSSVESRRVDGCGTASSGSPSTARREQGRGPGSRPVEATPGSNVRKMRGNSNTILGGGSLLPEKAKSAAAASGEEPPTGGIGLLARGGTFLGKFFAGRDEREVKDEAERLFEKVRVVKPPASRSGSGEMYLLATGFLLGGRKKRQ